MRDYIQGIPNTRFPEIWERFISHAPTDARHNPANYYLAQMTSGEPKLRQKFAYEWAYYEGSRLNLVWKSEAELKREIKSEPYESLAVLEAHYISNLCFLADGYILENAYRIPRVPIPIIHGRYDDICPAESAIRLHHNLPTSNLHIVLAGHAGSDPEIRKKLISETGSMIAKLRK